MTADAEPSRVNAGDGVRFDALSYLVANAARAPQAPAIWQDDQETSFAQLLAIVYGLIEALRRHGIGDRDVVAVALPNIATYVALELAVPATGATLFPIPMGIGRRELASVLGRSGARLLITDGTARGRAAAEVASEPDTQVPLASAEDLERAAAAGSIDRATAIGAPDPDRVVQIALTSGTTGMPKLASLSAQLKQLTFEGFTQRLRVVATDRMFPMSPITQGVGEMCLYAMRRGATLVMFGDARFDPETALSIAERSRTTILGGVPTMLGRMLHSPRFDETSFEHLRLTVSAGAALAPSVASEWERRTGSPIGSFYGAMDIGQLAVPDPADPADKRWTTVGRPHDTAEWQICDPDGTALGIGETGEICMRGPLVQDRYWGEDATPYAKDGWAHFGDLGFVDEQGFVHITGRVKDTIIRGGNNINPLEVEQLLREHPLVRDACVVGTPDPDLGERAVAFVSPAPGPPPTLAQLTAFLEERGFTRYKWPERLKLVETLPTGTTGKVDRSALRAQATATQVEVTY
jgi:long-chain acyl-CoA synthetase